MPVDRSDDTLAPFDEDGRRQYPMLPMETYLVNAGSSIPDALALGAEIRKRVKLKLRKFLEAHPEVAARVAPFPGGRDPHYQERIELNRRMIVDVLGDLRIERDVLAKLDRGLKAGLVAEEKAKTATARTTGADGRVEEFEVTREGAGESQRVLARSTSTGDLMVHRADSAEAVTYHTGGGQTRTEHRKPAGEA